MYDTSTFLRYLIRLSGGIQIQKKKKQQLKISYLLVKDVQRVALGRVSSTLKNASAIKENCYFSLLTKDRSLDLETETPEDRDLWAHSFKIFLKHFKHIAEAATAQREVIVDRSSIHSPHSGK